MDDPATSAPSIWASLNSWFTSTVFFVLLNLMIATILFTSNLPDNNKQTHHQHEEEEPKQNSHNDNHHPNRPKIARSPSILHRLKSFNFPPLTSDQEFSPDTHQHLQALEAAATQYVFNQPLHYEHFDLDPTASYQLPPASHSSPRDQTYEGGLPGTETHVWEERQTVETVETHFVSDPIHHQIQRDTDFEDADEEDTDEFQSLDEVYSRLKGGGVDRTKSDGDFPPKPPPKVKRSASLKVGFSHLEEEEVVEARRPATTRERKEAVEEDDVEVDAKADDFINKFKNDLILQRIESIARTKAVSSRGTAK